MAFFLAFFLLCSPPQDLDLFSYTGYLSVNLKDSIIYHAKRVLSIAFIYYY